jgi:hypothetical protein
VRGRSAAVLATFAIGGLAAVGALNLGLLSSDPASGEFGLLEAPAPTDAPTTPALGGPAVESSLSSSTTVATTTAPTAVASATPPAATTANAAPPEVTTAPVVSLARKASPPSIEPPPESTIDDHHHATSAPRRPKPQDPRPRGDVGHDDD